MYKYNENPELPSLKSLQMRINDLAVNPVSLGYVTYTGHKLTQIEADSLNNYIKDALKPTIYNDQSTLSGVLDRRMQTFMMIAEEWVYVIGMGRYAHPDEAKSFINNQNKS